LVGAFNDTSANIELCSKKLPEQFSTETYPGVILNRKVLYIKQDLHKNYFLLVFKLKNSRLSGNCQIMDGERVIKTRDYPSLWAKNRV